MKTLICIIGRNSAGKTAIAKKISKEFHLKLVRSYTTRLPRDSEKQAGLENSDHIFISESEFNEIEKKPENIAAATVINDVRYCTTIDTLRNSDIYVIDPKGVKDLKKKLGNEFHIVQFYIYAEENIRKSRYISRGETQDAFCKRNEAEAAQFREYETNHEYDIVIYNNGDIEDAVKTISSYISIILEKSPEANYNPDAAPDLVETDNQNHQPDSSAIGVSPHESSGDLNANNEETNLELGSANEQENDIGLCSRFSIDDDENDGTLDKSATDGTEGNTTNLSDNEDIIIIE